MIDHGITAFWQDDLDLLREEFKEEFNNITNAADGQGLGLHTFIFSCYHDYKIYTEVFYVQVFENCAIFLWAPFSLILNLDDELQVISGDFIPDGNLFLRTMFGDINELEHIGPITDYMGNCYEVFSLRYDAPLQAVKNLYEDDKIVLTNMIIDDDVIMDAAMKFLEYRIELFAVQVESSIDNDEPNVAIDENPFQSMYFDREIHTKMLRDKRALGQEDV